MNRKLLLRRPAPIIKLPLVRVSQSPVFIPGTVYRRQQEVPPPQEEIVIVRKPQPQINIKNKREYDIQKTLSDSLASRAKMEAELAMETFWDNEKRGSDPTGNPTWIIRTPSQGPEKGKSHLP